MFDLANAVWVCMMTLMENMTHEIASFCRKHGIPDSRFGREAMNDPAFVYSLREGRDLKVSTVNKLRAFMENYKPK